MTWWAFGGAQHGLTPMQAAEMPTSMRLDFAYILGEIQTERRRSETLDAKRKKLEAKT